MAPVAKHRTCGYMGEPLEIGYLCLKSYHGGGIRGGDGTLLAGLSVSAPVERMKPAWSALVKETAEKISRCTGWSG